MAQITRKQQLERAMKAARPIEVKTVEGQISFAEAGYYSDDIKKRLGEVQRQDMIAHCKIYKPTVIPKMKYPTMRITMAIAETFFKKCVREAGSIMP